MLRGRQHEAHRKPNVYVNEAHCTYSPYFDCATAKRATPPFPLPLGQGLALSKYLRRACELCKCTIHCLKMCNERGKRVVEGGVDSWLTRRHKSRNLPKVNTCVSICAMWGGPYTLWIWNMQEEWEGMWMYRVSCSYHIALILMKLCTLFILLP